MFNVDDMLHLELIFPEGFTSKQSFPWGWAYHNTGNPLSHDSNHAHIVNLDAPLPAAIDEIVRFYQDRSLTPRIYPAYQPGEYELLAPLLVERGFALETRPFTFMRCDPAYQPGPGGVGECFPIDVFTAEMEDLIQTGEPGEWIGKVLRRHLHDPRFHLLGVYDGERLAGFASVKIMAGYSRVDDVMIHGGMRRRGFGTRLINYLIQYHSQRSDNHLCLLAVNPIAIHMYQQAGFQEVDTGRSSWSAQLQFA